LKTNHLATLNLDVDETEQHRQEIDPAARLCVTVGVSSRVSAQSSVSVAVWKPEAPGPSVDVIKLTLGMLSPEENFMFYSTRVIPQTFS
jgi:hypothetical protein